MRKCSFSHVDFLPRRELYRFGVKVSIIEPGSFFTGLSNVNDFRAIWDTVPAEIKKLYGQEYWNNCEFQVIRGGICCRIRWEGLGPDW